jgi:hypothetical protein
MWRLVAGGNASVEYLGKRINPIDPKQLARLLADLDDARFTVREKAQATLAGYGRWIEGLLVDTQKKSSSDEVRIRIARLLEGMRVPGAPTLEQERLRTRRMMEVLEQVNTAPARKVLQALAQGAPEADLRTAADSALQRLLRRDKSGQP